tara:strand:+ start:1675 stop:2547 length:873 start_codon:yes stop_codon:yes gene_type:complete
MEKDQIIILKDRGIISISGEDHLDFLQNVVTNDINKVTKIQTLFSGIFTPQGKYLFEFFILKSSNGFYLECDENLVNDLLTHLEKFKLRSRIKLENLSSGYVVGIIANEKFKEIQKLEGKSSQTIWYRSSPFFQDLRSSRLGARVISPLEKLYLTIKRLSLKIVDEEIYLKIAHENGIPIKGLENLQNNLFGLEANLEKFSAIDFKKGCYVGQENTARMKLKNKIRKKLLPIRTNEKINIGSEIMFNGKKIGKILIGNPYPFALINLFDPNFSDFKDKEVFVENKKINFL